jgi:hypothetical protein
MNIHEIREKIKQPRVYEPIAFIFIFTLISLASFGLGRLSMNGTPMGDGGVTILMPDGSLVQKEKLLSNISSDSTQKTTAQSVATDGSVFASKNGSTYYFVSCGSSSRIKEENKVWFQSDTAAQNAGYHLAKACE